MRLYNAQSCTPVGSSSIFVAPRAKENAPKSLAVPSKRSENVRKQRERASVHVSNHSEHDTKLFNPFRHAEDPTHDAFAHKIASRSSETSATDELTPEFAAISKEFSSGSEAYDDFRVDAFPEQQQQWKFDYDNEVVNNEAENRSVWSNSNLTSSTLSTNFTATMFGDSHPRVEVTVAQHPDEILRAFSDSPVLFPTQPDHNWPTTNKEGKEQPVRNPWPAQDLPDDFFPELSSNVESPKNSRVVDPFQQKNVTFKEAPKAVEEINPVDADGDDYKAIRKNLRKVKAIDKRPDEERHPAAKESTPRARFDDAFLSTNPPDSVTPKRNDTVGGFTEKGFSSKIGHGRTHKTVRFQRAEDRELREPPSTARHPVQVPATKIDTAAKDVEDSSSFFASLQNQLVDFQGSKGLRPTQNKAAEQPQRKPASKTKHPVKMPTQKLNDTTKDAGDSSSFFTSLQNQLVDFQDSKGLRTTSTQTKAAEQPQRERVSKAKRPVKRPIPKIDDTAKDGSDPSLFFASLQKQLVDFQDTNALHPTENKAAAPGTRVKLSKQGLSQLQEAERQQRIEKSAHSPAAEVEGKEAMIKQNSGSDGPALDDSPDLAKYLKMLKMGLPPGAVKNAMQRDGVDPCLLDGDTPNPAQSAVQHAPKPIKDNYRRIRLHWDEHEVVRNNTVWAMVGRDSDVYGLRVDEEEFLDLFRSEKKQSSPKSPNASSPTDSAPVKLIDAKRANNGGITLARIKLSYEEIAIAVNSLDQSALTQEQIAGIIQYLPTTEEKKVLIDFLNKGSPRIESLSECEKFMVAILGVRKARQKLNALMFMQRFSTCLEEIRHDARLLHKACDEIMCSSGFRKILGIVLSLGNRLNAAGPHGKTEAAAITLESLLKLHQVKAFDKETTFLQWLVSVIRRNNASLIHFKDEMASVFQAQKIQWDQTLAELRKMEAQLEAVRKLAVHYSRESCLEYDYNDGESATLLSRLSLAVEDEAKILRCTPIGMFTIDACVKMAAVVDEVENAKTAFNACLLYFGEEESNLHPCNVFGTLSKFCNEFESASLALAKKEKEQMRQAKQQPANPSTTRHAGKDPTAGKSSGSPGRRGVLNELRGKAWRRRKHL